VIGGRPLLAIAGPLAVPGWLSAAQPIFEEILPEESGITWVHENALSEERYLPETVGPGCAFLDYDRDGWIDVYLINSGPSDFYEPPRVLENALYRNNGDGTFTDVTAAAGVAGGTFGMGVAAGDYDNDGFPDLFLTSYGRTLLYRNKGDGTFDEVTERARLSREGWTTSAVWFDYDDDGRLDLFVCSFVDFSPRNRALCEHPRTGKPYYCVPILFPPTRSFLFRNQGDGTFREAGQGSDLQLTVGKALGVVATDVNNDGRLDLFVANDTVQNHLFLNRGENRWTEAGLPAGVGLGEAGQARSGMGVDAADVDGDGFEDLFVANIDREIFSLYRNGGNETFTDVSLQHDIGQATWFFSGWGLRFFDHDNDGLLDLLLANGHPDDQVQQMNPQVTHKQRLLLFRQEEGRFRDVSARAGPVFSKPFAARGLAVGDLDNDGRSDVLVANNGGPPLVMRNESATGNHWLGLELRGRRSNRDAVGARITWSAGGRVFERLKRGGGSYLASHDPREILGLGKASKVDWLEIRWPGPAGHVERFTNLAADRYLAVAEK
jgi:hypothetical protein